MLGIAKRRLFQIGSLVVSNSYVGSFFYNNIYQGWFKGVCVPFLNCYGCPLAVMSCPIGTLQHFVIIKAIPFFLIGFVGVVGLLIGRMFCGWLCPFGFFQEMLYKIKTKKFYPKRAFKYTKYAVLIGLTLLVAYWVGEPWFCKLCPVGTLEAGIPIILWNPSGDIFTEGGSIISRIGLLFYTKLFILGAIVTAAVFIHQPFCRYLCPMGAIWSVFNKFSLFRLKAHTEACGLWDDCLQGCPMDIDVHRSPNDGDCNRCLDCTKLDCKGVKFRLAWTGNQNRSRHKLTGHDPEQVKERSG